MNLIQKLKIKNKRRTIFMKLENQKKIEKPKRKKQGITKSIKK